MHRIERSEINQHELEQADDPSEQMEREIDAFLLVIAWVLIMAACVWLLHEIIRAAEHWPAWKWIIQ